LLRYFIHGDVSEELVNEIKEFLEKCLLRLGDEIDLIEIHMFGDERFYRHYLRERASGTIWGEDLGFPITYECRRGIPTMAISMPRMMKLDESIRKAVIEHEAGHAVLHSSPEFYIVSIPESFRRSLPPELDDNEILRLIHLLSIAIKDSEVTYLLSSKGIVENQARFALDMLQPSEEELAASRISDLDYRMRLVLAYSMLKPIAFASPLRRHEELGGKVSRAIRNYVRTLQPQLHELLMEFSEEMMVPRMSFQEDMEKGYELAARLNEAVIKKREIE